MPLNERIQRLEEKVAYLERHVTAQDRAMLELAEDLAALRREWRAQRERSSAGAPAPGEGDDGTRDERPPHY